MFLLPFAFFYNNTLLYPGVMTIVAFLLVFAGFVAISVGLTGRAGGKIPAIVRPVFIAFGLGSIFVPSVIGQALITAIILISIVHLLRSSQTSRFWATTG